jgi:hypothetical protein
MERNLREKDKDIIKGDRWECQMRNITVFSIMLSMYFCADERKQ